MSQTLHATTAELTARTAFKMVRLVKITTYTDRAADTGSTDWYFSDGNLQYDYGNTGTNQNFTHHLLKLDDEVLTIPHLPDAAGGSASEGSSRRRMGVRLLNEPFDGGNYLSEQLTNLLFADIEISEMPRDDRAGDSMSDLTDLDGDEHRVLFRGFVEQIVSVFDTEIQLACLSKQPHIDVEYATGSTVGLDDKGRVQNKVYGDAKKILGIKTTAPQVGNLAVAITGDATSIELSDATNFPSSGSARIDFEDISWTGKSSNTLTTVTRGENSTAAIVHSAGVGVVELISSFEVEFADHALLSLDSVFVRLANSELLRIPSSSYSTDLANAQIAFTQAQQKTLLELVVLAAKVTEQSEVVNESNIQVPDQFNLTLIDASAGILSRNINSAGVALQGTTLDDEWSNDVWITTSLDDTKNVLRWRTVMKVDHTLSTTTGGGQIIFRNDGATGPTGIPWTPLEGNATDVWIVGDWETPAAGTKASDLEGTASKDGVYLVFNLHGVSNQIALGSSVTVQTYGVEVEFTDSQSSTVSIDSPGGAVYGLNFVADCSGYVVPWAYAEIYDFSQGATWSTLNATHTDNTTSQKITCTSATTCRIQINALDGTNDLSDANGKYQISVKSTDSANITSAKVYFAASGSGTTPPAARRELDIPIASLVDGSFVTLDIDSSDVGSPTLTDCESLGIEIVAASGTPALELDFINGSDEASNPYSSAMNTVLEKPTDVVRHFIAVVAGEGESAIDTTTEAAALTDLGSNILAGSVTVFGTSFSEILEHIVFESRMNIVPSEETTATVWKMLTANADYSFDAASGSITEWSEGAMVMQSKDEDQVLSRAVAFWNWDSSKGIGVEAFPGVISCTPSQNDISALVPTADLNTAEAKFGVKPTREFLFLLIQDEATAEDVFAYIMHEFLRDARTLEIPGTVSWETYGIEPGDIRTVTPVHSSSSMKMRVIQRAGVNLIAIEVD